VALVENQRVGIEILGCWAIPRMPRWTETGEPRVCPLGASFVLGVGPCHGCSARATKPSTTRWTRSAGALQGFPLLGSARGGFEKYRSARRAMHCDGIAICVDLHRHRGPKLPTIVVISLVLCTSAANPWGSFSRTHGSKCGRYAFSEIHVSSCNFGFHT